MAPPSCENDAVLSDPLTEEITTIPILPFEIIEEILSKLPVKFLMQLKSVCKSWKILISDPKFAKKHLRVSTTRHHVLVTYTTNPSREFRLVDYPFSSVFTELTAAASRQLDFPLPNGNPFDYIVGSCHGIICFHLDHQFALLWNPSIRKFMKLPSLENPQQERSYTAYGFGYVYDHFNDNYSYKVAAVNYYDEFDDMIYKTQVKVYTLGTDHSWRMIQDFPYGVPFDSSGTFVSGTVNWMAIKYSDIPAMWVIVSLDLHKESYQEIMQPDYGVESVGFTTLAVLRDCLSILAYSQSDDFSDVWLMEEYGNTKSWTKLFRFPDSCLGDLESCPYIKPLYLTEDDQVLLECEYELQSERHSELAIYNSTDSTFKTTEIQNTNRSIVLVVYQESLISPCS